jgi:hypothetical protein
MTGYIDPASKAAYLAQYPFGTPTYVLQGGVGIGTTTPVAALHVVSGNYTRSVANHVSTNNVVLVSATTNGGTKLLAIKNPGNSTNANYMSFIHLNIASQNAIPTYTPQVLGAIEGDAANGVQFASPEADYAEYILKEKSDQAFMPGDVVSVDSGRVSHKTAGRHFFMVISTGPVIAGNWPGENQSEYALTAFMGQVPVKVVGTVKAGDYLIPSGRGDGTAIAVSLLAAVAPDNVIGQAWESASGPGVHSVKSLIGLPFKHQVAALQFEKTASFKTQVSDYRSETAAMEKDLMAKIQARADRIAQLRNKLAQLKR